MPLAGFQQRISNVVEWSHPADLPPSRELAPIAMENRTRGRVARFMVAISE
jgi:hypothetical protein